MDPLFIYLNELEFDDLKRFMLKFSKDSQLKIIFFSTKKDYFITRMICHLKLKTDITNEKKLEKIK